MSAEQLYSRSASAYKYQHATPAMYAQLSAFLEATQKHQQRIESHNVWRIPIKVVYQTNDNRPNWYILPDLARSVFVGIEGVDAADVGREADQTEIQIPFGM
jgi:hypothetical protein